MTVLTDRRRGSRVAPEHTHWSRGAMLRPDQDVAIIDLGPGGALIESGGRMQPGARAELILQGPSRCVIRGRIDRCRVVAIEPLQYEAVMVFDEPWESGHLDRYAAPNENFAPVMDPHSGPRRAERAETTTRSSQGPGGTGYQGHGPWMGSE